MSHRPVIVSMNLYPRLEPRKIFVYGTLMEGFPAHLLLRRSLCCRPLGKAWMPGVLFDLGGYPGAFYLRSRQEVVRGELYEFRSDRIFSVLDDYEGYVESSPEKSLFIRQRVAVLDQEKKKVEAWTYLFNRPLPIGGRIVRGDYRQHRRALTADGRSLLPSQYS